MSYRLWTLCAALALALCLVRAQNTDAEYNTMYQGDIMLTESQRSTLEATSNPNDPFSPQQAVVRNKRSLWPNAVVPYVIDGTLGNFPHCMCSDA